MYFTPDGRSAVVVAEALKRLDFRDPHTMALQHSLAVPECAGINHADFSIDGRVAIFTCEFQGRLRRSTWSIARSWAVISRSPVASGLLVPLCGSVRVWKAMSG